MLTGSEIQADLGAAPQDSGTRRDTGVARTCHWMLPQNSSVLVQALVYRDAAAAVTGFQDIEKTFMPATSVSGVGERATFNTQTSSGSNEANLTVLRGRVTLSLNHSSSGRAANQTQLVALAQKALARIRQ